MKRRNLVGCVLGIVSLLAGCAPRGETKTLDEVLAIAKKRYQAVQTTSVSMEVAPLLRDMESRLELLTSSADDETLRSNLASAGDTLDKLVLHTGYTARPALGELKGQYERLSAREQEVSGMPEVRLLAARTYGLLAAELETTRFSIVQ